MKLDEKYKAIDLRRQGKSYSDIRKIINVSKSSLSLWLKDIILTDKQKHELYFTRRQINAYKLAKNKQKIKEEKIISIGYTAAKEAKLLFRNKLFLSGLMLYWAEGDKSNKLENVKFTNSDPEMIKLMMNWFRQICKVPNEKIHVALHIHTLLCRKNIEIFWSKITGIPTDQFHKTQIKVTTLKHRKNPLYNGTCAIVINDRDLFRRIIGWKNGVLELF